MPAPSRRRKAEPDESDSDEGPSQHITLSKSQAEAYQTQIMMIDLGSTSRDIITSSEKGPRVRPVDPRQLQRMRECNQEGTEAAERASQNMSEVKDWTTYFHTTAEASSGHEKLTDMGGGQSHRLRINAEIQAEKEQRGGHYDLDDTYDDGRGRRSIPPAMRNHAGNAAFANDRGQFGSSRGGGFAARGMGRPGPTPAPGPSNRPLDPAVDPDRAYVYKDSKRKRGKPNVQFVNNVVTVKAPSNPHGPKSKSGGRSFSTPRQVRGPLPDFIQSGPNLPDPDIFMAHAVKMLEEKAKTKPTQPSSSANAQSAALTGGPVQPVRVKEDPVTLPVKSLEQPRIIERAELGQASKSPSAFTDGQMTVSSLSDVSPSLDDNHAVSSSATLVGLGIRGTSKAAFSKTENLSPNASKPSPKHVDIMDVEIPAAKNAGLTPPLTASPRNGKISISKNEFEEYQAMKAALQANSPAAILDWFKEQKEKAAFLAKEQAVETSPSESSMQKEVKTSVNISGGYTIAVNSLERIVGDSNNVKVQAKSTSTKQTTPSLTQSKWATGQFKKTERGTKPAVSSPLISSTFWGDNKVEEMVTAKSIVPSDTALPSVKPKIGKTLSPVAASPFQEGFESAKQVQSQGHVRSEPVEVEFQPDVSVTDKPRPNPFGLRNQAAETTSSSMSGAIPVKQQLTPEGRPVLATKSYDSADSKAILPGAKEYNKSPIKSFNKPSAAPKKSSLQSSKWSTEPSAPLQSMPINQSATRKESFAAGSRYSDHVKPGVQSAAQSSSGNIFGDSQNMRTAFHKARSSYQPKVKPNGGIVRTGAGPGLDWILAEQAAGKFPGALPQNDSELSEAAQALLEANELRKKYDMMDL